MSGIALNGGNGRVSDTGNIKQHKQPVDGGWRVIDFQLMSTAVSSTPTAGGIGNET